MGTRYTKQPISIADQIARQKSLGLIIADEAKAEKTLGQVSYFRFASYLRPMEADKQTHQFKPNSTFQTYCHCRKHNNPQTMTFAHNMNPRRQQ
jgi:abortive infection bacteriophage resistance protein